MAFIINLNVLLFAFVFLMCMPRYFFLFCRQQARSKIISRKFSVDPLSTEDIRYPTTLVSGIVRKSINFANDCVVRGLFESRVSERLICLTDDEKFARRRLISPKSVYSGLFDQLSFITSPCPEEINSLEVALTGVNAWVAFGVPSSLLQQYITLAGRMNLERAVFAVNEEEAGPVDVTNLLSSFKQNSQVSYTILRHGALNDVSQSKVPYRIVQGDRPLPNETFGRNNVKLHSRDFFQVMAEIVSLPKSFGCIYGLGTGGMIDAEIQVYMKSQGWSERIQIGLLLGDFMDKVEKRVEMENVADDSALIVRNNNI